MGEMKKTPQPFKEDQKVDLNEWDRLSPQWDKMGICIVVGQRRDKFCESGWMIKVMAQDGTHQELDSNWMTIVEEDEQP